MSSSQARCWTSLRFDSASMRSSKSVKSKLILLSSYLAFIALVISVAENSNTLAVVLREWDHVALQDISSQPNIMKPCVEKSSRLGGVSGLDDGC